MPICTSCSAPVDSLWTEYSSPTNIRLTVCGRCGRFADPYVEQPLLVLELDLLLLKPGVYRHELWNRGVSPLKAGRVAASSPNAIGRPGKRQTTRDEILSDLLFRLSAITVAVDAYLLWTETPVDIRPSAWLLLFACALELAVFQAGVTLACAIVLAVRRRWTPASADMAAAPPLTREFRYILVPLTIVLSSLPKTLLLLLLSLFPQGPPSSSSSSTVKLPFLQAFLETDFPSLTLSAHQLDRPWILRHLLSGLSNGFALKVLLAPLGIGAGASTACILAGYVARTVVLPLLGVQVGAARAG